MVFTERDTLWLIAGSALIGLLAGYVAPKYFSQVGEMWQMIAALREFQYC